ncbi:MAG: cytochrome C oxidase Cbb3 [Coriobacteriia bacterium]|nr:cytochrome C oxidase Cbb3 [Coriobacteriia bacterium]
MPTVGENIRYVYDTTFQGKRERVLHYVIRLGIIFAVALALEVLLFNMNFFLSAGYQEVSMNSNLELRQDSDGHYLFTEVDNSVEFGNLNTEVKDVYLDFDSTQPAQELTLKINFTDEAHKTYFDSTEYTVGIPEVSVSTCVDESKYVNLTTSGVVQSLRIELVDKDGLSYPVKIDGISINKPHPFSFNFLRFAVVLALLLLAYAFRPKSSLYRLFVVDHPGASKAVIVVSVVVEAFLVSGYVFYGANLVGVATESYNYGAWDGVSVANSYEVGGENAQQYAELAQSMAHGHLYLEQQPPQWLQDMEDPYDKGARDELQKETGESYLFDVAYYDGHYYVYFGVVPCVLFYLPYYMLAGSNFPTALGVLAMLVAFIVGCAALLDRFARYHFKRVSLGLYLLLQIPLVMCCGILYLAKFPTFYSLPIACALAFSVWGLYFWMKGRSSEKPFGWYFAGSLCMALVLGCRPTLMVFSLVAFPLFWRTYITKKRLFTKRGALEFSCLVAPYVLVAAGIMAYNYARFGSLTDFGANYNLTVNDMTKRGMNLGRLAPALFAYFLQPPNVVGVFPFLQAVDFQTTYMGQTIKEVTFGGIFACLPMLWTLAFAPKILKLRVRQRSTHTVAAVVGILLASGVVVAVLDAQVAGILQRYYADFSFMFLASVVLLVFIANENLPDGSKLKDALMKVLIALVGISVLYSVLLCFVPEVGWYSDVYPWAYQSLIEAVQFWT